MTPRERYLATLLYERPDHVPLTPGYPRESTLAAWHTQGLDPACDWLDAVVAEVGVPRTAFDTTISVPVSSRMIPTFEEKVLAHRDGHYLVQDWMGAITEIADTYDYTYIRSAKDFVTRRWHRFPVQTRADWEQVAWRYSADDATRWPQDWAQACDDLAASGLAVAVQLNGPFWQMREWVGLQGLCLLMVDDPAFVAEMAAHWQRFTLALLDRITRALRVDVLMVSEDMAYKAHSMISPAMARRFLQPTYLAWHELLSARGCRVFDMDSDGDISELAPLWLESGFNCLNPIEIAAGNDPLSLRARYGRRLALRGGLDKRVLAVGGAPMQAMLRAIVPPLVAEGGYIPSCDHGVPPDISWPNYLACTRELAGLLGWR